jgi:hypothetical protein
MKYLTEEFIGEQVDCEDFGIGTIVEVTNRKVVLAFNDGLVDIELDDIELVEEVEDIDELSKKTLAKYIPAAAKDAVQAGHDAAVSGSDQDFKRGQNRHKGIETAVKKLTREEIEDIDEGHMKELVTKYMDKGHSREEATKKAAAEMKEEVEDLDEVNANQIKKDLDSGMSYDAVIGKHANRATTNTDEIRKVIKQHAWNKRMKKESVELDEARGRPPKAPAPGKKPSAAWVRHLERKDKGEDKEELEALGAQLRKSVSINKPVTFLNGEKKTVDPRHISKFEDHMAARPRTIDKQKFQNDAHASHDAFVKAVTSTVPKPEGGTSSIVKYR